MKNIDRIRNMDVEELVRLLKKGDSCDCCVYEDSICPSGACQQGIEKWLNMEHEGTQTDVVNKF